jgi:alpha-beta hydrolase superfamily lysophospholipase
MKLEIISVKPTSKTHQHPLVFVHGAWHSAWSWENFLPYFADHGYECYAFSFRGHGASEGGDRLRWFSTHQYVADLEQIVEEMSVPPVLIAHSMGGYILQRYLEQHSAPAGVLLSSLPTVGIFGMMLRMLRRHPGSTLKALLLMNPWYFVSTPALAKDYLFSDNYPNDKFLAYYPRIQPESFRVALEATLLSLPRPAKVRTPLLVLAAENDRVFTKREQEKTAQAYNTKAIFYPNMAHDMMLEAGWQSVADRILDWLQSRNL